MQATQPDHDLLVRIDERTRSFTHALGDTNTSLRKVETEIKGLENKFEAQLEQLEARLEKKFVSQTEFEPYRKRSELFSKVVYTAAIMFLLQLILTAFIYFGNTGGV